MLLIGRVIWDFTPTHPDADPHTKEISIHWVNGRGPGSRERDYLRGEADYPRRFMPWDQERNLQTLLELQAAGKVRVGPLLTHRFPFDQAPQAAEVAINLPAEASAWRWSMPNSRAVSQRTWLDLQVLSCQKVSDNSLTIWEHETARTAGYLSAALPICHFCHEQ